jgi:hypothetical protein
MTVMFEVAEGFAIAIPPTAEVTETAGVKMPERRMSL